MQQQKNLFQEKNIRKNRISLYHVFFFTEINIFADVSKHILL